MDSDSRDYLAAATEVLATVMDCVADSTCEVRVRRFKHTLPCGPRRDPGPRDDSGVRGHWCFAVYIGGWSTYGRFDDVAAALRGWGR